MAQVVLVGGVGYLGLNGARVHGEYGDHVVVVTRKSSVSRRPRIFREVQRYASRVVYLEDLSSPRAATQLLERRCPDIVYMLVGRLRGQRRQLMESNARIPSAWADVAARTCPDTLFVYISSVLALGDPSPCARGGTVVEEERHGACRPLSPAGESKAAGEKLVLQQCGKLRVSVARLGLAVGRGAYHPEWRQLFRAARHGVVLGLPLNIHLTPAAGVFRFYREHVDLLPGCSWLHLTPWRVRVGELSRMFIGAAGFRQRLSLPLPRLAARLTGMVPRELFIQDRYRITSRYEFVERFNWGKPVDAIREAAGWCVETGCTA